MPEPSTRELAERAIDKLVVQGKVDPSVRESRVKILTTELDRHDRRMALRFFRSIITASAAAALGRELPSN